MYNVKTHISNVTHVALRRALEAHHFLVALVAEPVARLDLHDALPALLEAGTLDPHAGPLGRKADQIRHRPIAADVVLERTSYTPTLHAGSRQFPVTGVADLTSLAGSLAAVACPARLARFARVLAALAALAGRRPLDGRGRVLLARQVWR